jgi:hypothetical protein
MQLQIQSQQRSNKLIVCRGRTNRDGALQDVSFHGDDYEEECRSEM